VVIDLAAGANGGEAQAQCEIGLRYYQGNGVPQDWLQAKEWLTKAVKQRYGPARVHLAEAEAQITKGQKTHKVDGSTCLRDLVHVHLLEITPWQAGELQFEMHQGAAVQNLTNSYVMVNLWIHYSGSYTSNGYAHSPRYPVKVDKRSSLLLEPRAQATEWQFPVKGVYVWVPNAYWELTSKIDVARSTCHLYKVPPAHWDADSPKLLKGEAA